MAGSTSNEGDFGLQIAPMLDILFVLLLFFMVSAGSEKKERDLLSALPGNEGGPGVIPININVSAGGEVTLNGSKAFDPIMKNSRTPSELELKLKSIVADFPQQPVIISPSPKAADQTIMDVLNACTGAGVKNMAFSSVQ